MPGGTSLLDPSVGMSLLAPGLMDANGNFDPQAYQRARQNFGLMGLAASLLQAGGASRLPVTTGAALGSGLAGMMGAEQAYDRNALTGAQAGYYLANTGRLGLENEMMRARLPIFQRFAVLMGGGAPASAPAAAGGSAPSVVPSAIEATGPQDDLLTNSAPLGDLAHYASLVTNAESGGNPNAKNPNSSATGLGQFTNSTWLDIARKYFPQTAEMGDDALLALRSDPDFSRRMVAAYAHDNAGVLSGAGLPVNNATLYAAHFLGPKGAVDVLSADPNTPLSSILPAGVINANPNLKGQTAGQFAGMMAMKMNVPGNLAQTMRPVQMASTSAAPAVTLPNGMQMTPEAAQQLTGLAPLIGIQMPQWIQDLARMAPGGALSPEYLGAAERAKQMAGADLTDYNKALIAQGEIASQYGTDSPQYRDAQLATAKAAGVTPLIEPKRGMPGLTYNAATGQYEVANIPGYNEALKGMAGAKAAGEAAGRAQVEYGTSIQPGGAPNAPQPQPAGTTLAPGLTTTMPKIVEPAYTPAELKDQIPKWADMTHDLSTSIATAQAAEHRLYNIADAFKMIQSGAYRTDKAAFDAALKAAGAPTFFGNISAVELALHENYRATLQNLGAVNKRFTQNEFRIISEQSEHPDLQPEANLQMLSEDIGQVRQLRGLATDWLTAQTQLNAHNPEAFTTAWMNANPLSKFVNATKKEIGPLKGMAGGPQSSAAAAPRGMLGDGQIAIGPGGHRIQNRGGVLYDLQTGQPFKAPAPQAPMQ